MNTPQHTPGPWEISKHATPDYAPQYGVYTEGNSEDLATVCGENAKEDARLIAAAPELLAALQETEKALRWAAQEADGRIKREIVGGWTHHADLARAAINKATGNQE